MNAETNSAPAAEADALVWKTVTYPLLFPVGDVKELIFREPNGEELEAIDELGLQEGVDPNIRQVNQIIRILSGQSIDIVRKMNKRDIEGASKAMVPLLEGAI